MLSIRYFICTCFVFIYLGTYAQEEIVFDSLGVQLDRMVPRFVERGFSGAILIEKDGQIILKKGYGFAQDRAKIPFRTNTAFGIGTLSMQFMATAILQLSEQGKIALDAPISRYLQEVPDDKKAITIGQLLSYSSGLPDFFNNKSDHKNISRQLAFREIMDLPLQFKPGKSFLFSNAGYTLLAIIFEEITGSSYLDYLRQDLFPAAGMTETAFNGSQIWSETRVAEGRGFVELADNNPLRWPDPSWNIIGTGEIVTTLDDLYAWKLAWDQNRLVSAQTKELMMQKHALDKTQRFIEYGYGWRRKEEFDYEMIYNSGGGEYGQLATIRYYPEKNISIVLLSNSYQDVNPLAAVLVTQFEKRFLQDEQ
ncbi:MAG: beta-lactamase family protein [Saprospiraceae bacterium]|nr:beta-lactamase family protein [Saprospiraceae bacterium]MCB9318791.1 beta-lactamase family protein [Lewinellaceae bacterium]